MTIVIEPLDPALESYLLDLGRKAWEQDLTAGQFIYRERLTLDYADAYVVHEGWKQARNLWQSNTSYLFN